MPSSDFSLRLAKDAVKFTLHDVPDQPGMAAEIFDKLSQAGINVELVVQTARSGQVADIALAVFEDSVATAEKELNTLKDDIHASAVSMVEDVALVTLERENLSRSAGVAARMFHTLASLNVNIDLISTSLNSVTCLIARNRADDAFEALTREFKQ
jgi:aspartate kinase